MTTVLVALIGLSALVAALVCWLLIIWVSITEEQQ